MVTAMIEHKRTKELTTAGLLRCCVQSLDMHDDSDESEGAVHCCESCGARVRLDSANVWRWVGPKERA